MSFKEEDYESKNKDNISLSNQVKLCEGKQTLKCATPSVIRKGLCMVRNKGNQYLCKISSLLNYFRGENAERQKL